jgi:hypothetical protein
VMGGALKVIVDRSTLIPGTSRRFGSFTDTSDEVAAVRDGEVAFQNDGVYVMRKSGLVTIADRTTRMPATLRQFTQFGPVGFDQGKVAFQGLSIVAYPEANVSLRWGAYTDLLGPLRAIVSRSLLFRLDGKVVRAVFSSAEGFSDGVIALMVWFFDGSKGVYIAQPR